MVETMGRFNRLHWILFCILVFAASRMIMLYQYNLANDILAHIHTNFFSAMCKWDCKWYLSIIKDGYDLQPRLSPKVWKGLANWAFFPLYPLLVKAFILITGLPSLMAGVLLNQGLILIALMVFYKYLRLFVDDINSRFGVVLLAFSPFSVYFASLYTEALFLLLSLISFYFMRTNRPFLAAISGGLLSATRPVGVMFSIPYFLYQIHKSSFLLKIMFYTILTIMGLVCYMLYLHFHTGDFLAFHHIQKGWGRKGLDVSHLGSQIIKMLKDTHNSILFLLSCGISIYLIVKKYYAEGIFNLLCILPGVLTGVMMSEGRFCGTLFTFYFGLVILTRKSVSLKITLMIVFFLFYVSYFLYWLAHSKFLI
jgi:Gpi18-like mannosyltransferase